MGRGRNHTVSDSEIRDALNEPDQVVFLTEEVADQFDITERQMRDRLLELADNGKIRHRKVGSNHIWWHPFAESALSWPHPDDQPDRPYDIDAVYSKSGCEFAATLDLPGSGETLLNRQIAVSFVFRTILVEDKVPVRELERLGWIAEPESTYEDSESLWNNCLYHALDQVLLFQFSSGDLNCWELTPFGKILKEDLGERLFWNDWDKKQDKIRFIISNYFFKSAQYRSEREDLDFIWENRRWVDKYLIDEPVLGISFEDEPVWLQTPVTVLWVLRASVTEEFAAKIEENTDIELITDEQTGQPILSLTFPDNVEFNPQYFAEEPGVTNNHPPVQQPSDALEPLQQLDSVLRDLD